MRLSMAVEILLGNNYFYLDRCLVADSVGSALSLLWSSKFSSSFPTNDSGIYNKLTFMC